MSNLIKSAHVVAMEDLKKLQTEKRYAFAAHQESEQPLEHYLPTEEELQTRQLRDQIIEDAESYAKERLEQAAAEAEQMLQAAKEQIGQWWSERRAEDEQLEESLRKQGYDQGYQEGLVHAEEDNSRQWAQQIEDAKALLEQAYRSREEIIQEAEPFLVELSCSISEKIIGKQLTAAPDWALELVVKSLSRRREQGMIALCVAPDQLALWKRHGKSFHWQLTPRLNCKFFLMYPSKAMAVSSARCMEALMPESIRSLRKLSGN